MDVTVEFGPELHRIPFMPHLPNESLSDNRRVGLILALQKLCELREGSRCGFISLLQSNKLLKAREKAPLCHYLLGSFIDY